MRNSLFVVVLMTATSVVCGSQAEAQSRGNFEVGIVEPTDILLHRTQVTATAIPGQIQTQDVNYNNIEVVVTAIRATEIGSQNSVVQLMSAGVGWTGADLRFQSDVGKGYFYQLEVWGKIRR